MQNWRIWLSFLLLGLWAVASKMPPKPGPNDFLADYANVITVEQTKKQMQSDLRAWNARGKSRLFVATISSLAGYGMSDIQSGAQAWFQEWGLDSDDLLFLYSVGDRKARIQLGSDWQNSDQEKTDQIMRDVVVPPSLHGDYSLAVFRGANALHHFVEEGPQGSAAASAGIADKLDRGIARNLPYCNIPGPLAAVMFVVGALLLLFGLAGLPQFVGRPTMIAMSVAVFTATAFSSVVLPIIGVVILIAICSLLPHHHHHCHSWFGWGNCHSDGWFGGCDSWFGGCSGSRSWGGGCSDWW